MFLADFHIHTHFSDGRLSLREVVDFYGQREFGAIAITDHLCEQSHWLGHTARWLKRTLTPQSFSSYLEEIAEQAERALKQYNMLVIPGFEVTKNSTDPKLSAHILALGVTEWISPDLTVEDILYKIRDLGGLSIAAHPVSTKKFEPQTFYLWDHREELAELIDAWEVASGPFLFEEVHESDLPLIANSDLHHPRQINSWKSRFDCERRQQAIFDCIRQQQLEFVYYKDRIPALASRLLNESRFHLVANPIPQK